MSQDDTRQSFLNDVEARLNAVLAQTEARFAHWSTTIVDPAGGLPLGDWGNRLREGLDSRLQGWQGRLNALDAELAQAEIQAQDLMQMTIQLRREVAAQAARAIG